ncbi:MAG: type II CRISPR RNA-guided endonuclease Cas9 [Candidatus Cloacimonadota bacterium]
MLEKKYRLGIDLGSTSIGWALIELDENSEPYGITKLGVRIFPDGRDDKSKEPLSVSRRIKRGMRRNHDRYLQRMRKLLSIFEESGFIPQDTAQRKTLFMKDPYELRSMALDQKISQDEFARAILHLAKRRGFLSNRKAADDKEASAFKAAISNFIEQLEKTGSRTIGEYLYNKTKDIPLRHMAPSLRFRYDAKLPDDERVFPRRDLVMAEFEQIWEKQAQYHPELTASLKAEVFAAIFYQRPLKSPSKGKCIFFPTEERIAKAHPLFQEFRILQEVNNLRIELIFEQRFRDLAAEEKMLIYGILEHTETKKLSALRKDIFKVQKDEYRFNYETENRDSLKGNLTNIAFSSKKRALASEYWKTISTDERSSLVELLISDKDDQAISKELKAKGLSDELIEELMSTSLPSDYANLSKKAIEAILPYMKQGDKYPDACLKAGFAHSETFNGEVYPDGDLPYYGELLKSSVLPTGRKTGDKEADEHGKIGNPTVHIALNQLRKLINALADKYGAPSQIVLELARDLKMNKEQKEEYNKRLNRQTKDNLRIEEELRKISVVNNRENRTRYKLWEELSQDPLERKCVYSGKLIPIEKLFGPEFELEHILPKSRTYDDSISNKTISYYAANRYKGERSPFEAFGASADSYDWNAISERAARLPHNKRKRFLKDSMDNFKNESEVLARMLNDTRYMSRIARHYMCHVCGDKNVWVITGQQTAMIRKKWGLEAVLAEGDSVAKNRADHRHHAIDAFVISMMTPSLINRFSKSVKNSQTRFLERLGEPFPGFSHEDFKAMVDRILISFKPDQPKPESLRKRVQTAGPLMKDTAYGFIGIDPRNSKYSLYSERALITGLKVQDVEFIIDPTIREQLKSLCSDGPDKKVFKDRLDTWSKKNNVRRVKLANRVNPKTMIPIKDRQGKVFKFYSSDENLFIDIYTTNRPEHKGKWFSEIVKSYNAHQPAFLPEWKQTHPIGKLIMRLYKNDMVAFDGPEGTREIRRVRQISKGNVFLRGLSIAQRSDGLGDDVGEEFSPNQLQKRRAVKAGIDILGRAFDPLWSRKDANT